MLKQQKLTNGDLVRYTRGPYNGSFGRIINFYKEKGWYSVNWLFNPFSLPRHGWVLITKAEAKQHKIKT